MIRCLNILFFSLIILSSCASFEEKYPEQSQMIDEMIQDTNYLVNIINDTNLIYKDRGIIKLSNEELRWHNKFLNELFRDGYKIEYFHNTKITGNNKDIFPDCIKTKIVATSSKNYTIFWFCEENEKYKLLKFQINDIID